MLRNIFACKFYTRTSSPLTFDCTFVTIVSQWITLKPYIIKFDELVISFQIIIVILKKKEEGTAWCWEGAAWRNETRAWRRAMPKTPRPNTAVCRYRRSIINYCEWIVCTYVYIMCVYVWMHVGKYATRVHRWEVLNMLLKMVDFIVLSIKLVFMVLGVSYSRVAAQLVCIMIGWVVSNFQKNKLCNTWRRVMATITNLCNTERPGSLVVSTSAWHAAVRGSILCSDQAMLY